MPPNGYSIDFHTKHIENSLDDRNLALVPMTSTENSHRMFQEQVMRKLQVCDRMLMALSLSFISRKESVPQQAPFSMSSTAMTPRFCRPHRQRASPSRLERASVAQTKMWSLMVSL